MKRTADGLITILEAFLPAGCSEWISAHRPDIARYLAEAETALLAGAASVDQDEFIASVRYCSGLYERVAWIARLEIGRVGCGIRGEQ